MSVASSHCTIRWVENLADQERLIREGKRLSVDTGATRDEVLVLETASFLREVFHQCQQLTRLFNARVGDEKLSIRLLRHNEGVDAFSLVRNNVKLTLCKAQPGIIQFQCEKVSPEEKPSVDFCGLVEANFAAFNEIEWHFLGTAATAEQLARQCLTDFIHASRQVA